MDIEEFVSEENHMCNLGEDLFYKIIEFGAIYDLPDNEFNRKIVYWFKPVFSRESERTVRCDL
ncbi:Uncharacterised protein [Citrobacter freundii]|nr:Uncharacterised protein [Citrobacter freundii]